MGIYFTLSRLTRRPNHHDQASQVCPGKQYFSWLGKKLLALALPRFSPSAFHHIPRFLSISRNLLLNLDLSCPVVCVHSRVAACHASWTTATRLKNVRNHVPVWIHEPISSPSAAQAITSDCAKKHGPSFDSQREPGFSLFSSNSFHFIFFFCPADLQSLRRVSITCNANHHATLPVFLHPTINHQLSTQPSHRTRGRPARHLISRTANCSRACRLSLRTRSFITMGSWLMSSP